MEIRGNEDIKAIFNAENKVSKDSSYPKFLSQEELEKVRNFHKTIKDYNSTPLVNLDALAHEVGIKSIFVKDESKRSNLNSFKMLGASYAIAKLLCKKLDINIEEINFEYLKSEEVKKKIGDITFATCSDGNHGRAVAWTAKQLGYKAIIYMPKGTADRRVEAIRELGAEVVVTELNYDDTVRFALQKSKDNDWEMIQDTAWRGYTEVPKWIMQGYSTMAYEAACQLREIGIEKPTHIFIQAGVGAMAGAVLGCFVNLYDGKHPITTVMEPLNAACMFKSAFINDGKPHAVKGELKSIMAGLACGEPIPVGWEILRDFSYAFCTCPDYVTARGMRILANPLGEDKKIISGESGAVGTGLLSLLMQDNRLSEVKNKLQLNKDSIILLFSTEGSTDPVNYRKILWDGKYELLI